MEVADFNPAPIEYLYVLAHEFLAHELTVDMATLNFLCSSEVGCLVIWFVQPCTLPFMRRNEIALEVVIVPKGLEGI